MKVKELIKLLANVNPEYAIVVNVDGSVYPIDDEATEEYHQGYAEAEELGLHAGLWE